MMVSKDECIENLLNEKGLLKSKLEKLNKFINTDGVEEEVGHIHYELLKSQLKAMKDYHTCLVCRIAELRGDF